MLTFHDVNETYITPASFIQNLKKMSLFIIFSKQYVFCMTIFKIYMTLVYTLSSKIVNGRSTPCHDLVVLNSFFICTDLYDILKFVRSMYGTIMLSKNKNALPQPEKKSDRFYYFFYAIIQYFFFFVCVIIETLGSFFKMFNKIQTFL